jgi:SAM-dependent methyltransferase
MSQTQSIASEVVREKWNDTMQKRAESKARKFSWHSAVVQTFMREQYLDEHSVSEFLCAYLGERKIRRALEVGGGLGEQTLALYRMLNIEQCDVLDISDVAVAEGNKRARKQGINVRFIASDLNTDPLPEHEYDLIIASGSLHHISNLEHLFEQINARLAPDGVLFANDYMGPTQMQWRPKQLELMNSIVDCLPDEMNKVAHKNDAVVRQITPIPLDIFARHDPSEGVRAADIFDVMEQYLDIERIAPFGQTLAYETLRGRIQNFDDDDPKDKAILSLICVLEKELIEAGAITSDFNLVIARPKRQS